MAILSRPTLFREEGLEGKLQIKDPAYNQIVGINGEAIYTGTQKPFLPYGRFLVENTNYQSYRLPQAGDTSASFAGVSLAVEYYEHSIEVDTFGDSVHGYPTPVGDKKCPITVVKKGIIYLLAEDDITAASGFFIRIVENGVPLQYEGLGRIRSDADGTNAVAAPSTARLLEDVVAGDLARVAVEFPQYGAYA